MRLLVFGKTGQVAQALARRCPDAVDLQFLGRDQADLSNPNSCARAIALAAEDAGVDAVINAAAWTAVDAAETAEAEATVVNSDAPAAMARACALACIPFIQISSDYVFDGAGTHAYAPDHPIGPLNAYGRSKCAAELAIRASGARHLILRTSWVFSASGTNFVTKMLDVAAARDRLSVVSDQTGGPTPAASIADALFVAADQIVAGHPGGTYHFCGHPYVSRADFARAIMAAAGLGCRIEDIASADYAAAAACPLNSRLDCTSFTGDFGVVQPNWAKTLDSVINDLRIAA